MADRKLSGLTSITGANLAAGDIFHVQDISEASTADQNKSITRTELVNAVEEDIFTTSATYTPVFQGFGTVSSSNYWWKLINSDLMFISGYHVDGTVTANEAQIGLPSGYKMHTSVYTSATWICMLQRNSYTTARYHLLATGGDTYFNVARADAAGGADPFTPMDGNDGLGSIEIQSFQATIFVETV